MHTHSCTERSEDPFIYLKTQWNRIADSALQLGAAKVAAVATAFFISLASFIFLSMAEALVITSITAACLYFLFRVIDSDPKTTKPLSSHTAEDFPPPTPPSRPYGFNVNLTGTGTFKLDRRQKDAIVKNFFRGDSTEKDFANEGDFEETQYSYGEGTTTQKREGELSPVVRTSSPVLGRQPVVRGEPSLVPLSLPPQAAASAAASTVLSASKSSVGEDDELVVVPAGEQAQHAIGSEPAATKSPTGWFSGLFSSSSQSALASNPAPAQHSIGPSTVASIAKSSAPKPTEQHLIGGSATSKASSVAAVAIPAMQQHRIGGGIASTPPPVTSAPSQHQLGGPSTASKTP